VKTGGEKLRRLFGVEAGQGSSHWKEMILPGKAMGSSSGAGSYEKGNWERLQIQIVHLKKLRD